MDLDEMIKVMQAYHDGAEIEYSALAMDTWLLYEHGDPCWDWSRNEYRIKAKSGKDRLIQDFDNACEICGQNGALDSTLEILANLGAMIRDGKYHD